MNAPLKTRAQLDRAIARVKELWGAPHGSPEGDELDALGAPVEQWQRRNIHVPPADPIDAIEFRVEQAGLRPVDLVPYTGSASKVSEVLARKRPLSLAMIRRLVDGLGIPAKILAREPRKAPARKKARKSAKKAAGKKIVAVPEDAPAYGKKKAAGKKPAARKSR